MDVLAQIPNLPSMRTQFVNLWIDNGEGPVDYGLFTHVERVNQYYAIKRGWNNPIDTEKFYFVPWDYDEAMGEWVEPPNDMSSYSLRQRVEYGYALSSQNTFLSNFYKLPGIHEDILAAIERIRLNHVTHESMAEKISHYLALTEKYQERAPDNVSNPNFNASLSVDMFSNLFDHNEESLRCKRSALDV